MKFQLPILRQQGIEVIAKLNGASGIYMSHNCRTEGLGRYLFFFQILYTDFLLYVCTEFDSCLFQIKKMPCEHTCQSTGKVEKNCMATNHWVKDRVMDWLAKDNTIGAT